MRYALLVLLMAAVPASGQDLYGDPLPSGALARMGTVRLHVCGEVLAFSPDEKTFAVASNDIAVRLWDVATGLPIRAFEKLSETPGKEDSYEDVRWPYAAVFSADGKTLLTLCIDSLCTWNTATGKLARKVAIKIECGDPRRELALSADGKSWAVVSRKGLCIGETATGKTVALLSVRFNPFNYLRFSPDGNRLVYLGARGIEVWDIAGRRVIDSIVKQSPGGNWAPFFSPDGKSLVLMSERPTRGPLTLCHLGSGKKPFEIAGDIHAACFTPDGTSLIVSIGNEVKVWDLARQRFVRSLPIPESSSLFVSPRGRYLLTHDAKGVSVRVWDLVRGTEVHSLRPGHRSFREPIAFSPDGKTLVAGEGGNCVLLWQASSGRLLRSLEISKGNGHALRFSPDGKRLFVGPGDFAVDLTRLNVYEFASGKKLHEITETHLFDVSPDGERLLRAGHDASWNEIVVSSDVSGKHERWQHRLKGDFDSLAFLGDGQRYLVTTGNRGIRYEVRQTDTGKELFHWHREYNGKRRAVSPDGRSLAIHYRAGLDLVDVENGKVCQRLVDAPEGSGYHGPPAFSPDGALLALASTQFVRVWEAATGTESAVFEAPANTTFDGPLAFSPDGRRLASAGGDQNLLIWDLFGSETPGQPAQLSDAELSRCWKALAEEKAADARSAIGAMLRSPQRAIPFLKTQFNSLKQPDAETIRSWVADLSAKSFAVRRAAARKLEDAGDFAEKELRRVLAGQPELETARRIETLLEQLHPLRASGEPLRLLRAIQLLDRIATPDTRPLLKTLADGAAGVRLAAAARHALTRLDRAATR